MRIVFFGTPSFSVPILEALHHQYEVVLVVTQPDTYDYKKKVMRFSPVKEKAIELGLDVCQPERIKTSVNEVLNTHPDIIITAAYGQILPKPLLEIPPYKAINVHASLLPKLRGGAPIQRAIERLHQCTGVTIMQMVPKMDAGAIIAQSSLTINPRDTSDILFEKLSHLGVKLLLQTLPLIKRNEATYTPQNEDDATYAYALKREEEKLDFHRTAEQLDAKIRAFYPSPNTYFNVQNTSIKVIEAHFLTNNHMESIVPGTIVGIDKNALQIQSLQGILCITKVQLPGKKAMPIAAFMNGKGQVLIKINTCVN